MFATDWPSANIRSPCRSRELGRSGGLLRDLARGLVDGDIKVQCR